MQTVEKKRPTILSADNHIMEPGDLWLERLPAKYKDLAPRIYKGPNCYHMAVGDKEIQIPGFNSCLLEGRPGIEDPDARAADLAADGVDIEVLYPQRTLVVLNMRSKFMAGYEDDELVAACLRAYNEWLSEFCASHPGRFIGIAQLPVDRPEAVADELAAIKHLGFKSVQMPSKPQRVEYNSPDFYPAWAAIEESGLPASFHIGEGGSTATGLGAFGAALTIRLRPFRNLWPVLIFAGILDRFPGVRLVFAEGGIAWVPAMLYDADLVYREYFSECEPKLSRKPSEYWRSNCFATFEDDPVGLRSIDLMGPETVMWANDYPHPEGVFGRSREVIQQMRESLGEEITRAITYDTAARLYGLEPAKNGN